MLAHGSLGSDHILAFQGLQNGLVLDHRGIPGAVVFHAGTAQDGARRLITSGGRVLSVTIRAPELAGARAALYRAADMIQFRGRVMRRDLARDES